MTKLPVNIPPFDNNGNLPDGVYLCNEEIMEIRFVTAFSVSQTRPVIFNGFKAFRSDSIQYGIIGTQWVDGSFVTSKPDPADVDVVTFCDYELLNHLNADAQKFVLQYINGCEATKAKYCTHAFLVPCCSPGHAYFAIFEAARAYWRKWFGTTRPKPNPPGPDISGQPKGLLEMPLGDPSCAPKIDSTTRSSP